MTEESQNRSKRKSGATTGLHELPGFRDLPDSILADLQAMCRWQAYKADQTILDVSAHSEFIRIVRDGILKMQKTMLDGRQHIVGLLVEGDMFGRVFDTDLHYSVEAATDAEVYMVRRSSFEALLLRSPELDHLLMLNVLNELDRARDWMIILANPKVRGRLAGFLLLLCTRYQTVDHLVTVADQAIQVHIPLNRRDLAHLLGARVESVSRAFHALAKDGLIEILRPDVVIIRQIEDLSDEAGEDEFGDVEPLRRLTKSIHKSSD